MSLAEISQYLGLVLAVIAILGHAKGYFSSGEKTLTARMDKAEKTLVDHDRRIQAVEGEMKHLPSKDSVNELKLALTELKGDFKTLTETLGSVSRTVHRIDDYLREEAK
ncbi:DUF2730 family protein [Rhizobium sp. YS-1r]|uniref:DUF2730 family protein n=1 Tax=Rhizobium sp. YS-1r TaxID=1532558 RepID=UPI00050DF60E|nr:DUF2730 family protein [Rhizobium sp. YS-1r]KGE00988.1 hypothetical protein JL39_07540 [Rhizobium sp. YS-1r]